MYLSKKFEVFVIYLDISVLFYSVLKFRYISVTYCTLYSTTFMSEL